MNVSNFSTKCVLNFIIYFFFRENRVCLKIQCRRRGGGGSLEIFKKFLNEIYRVVFEFIREYKKNPPEIFVGVIHITPAARRLFINFHLNSSATSKKCSPYTKTTF